jgi:threonine/homoserine efflux transporter RhtA
MDIDRAARLCFAADYASARAKFLDACRVFGIATESHVNPLPGPRGEELATDTAWIGPADAQHVVAVISGTHGVEGFCGGGVQVDWLLGGGSLATLSRGDSLVAASALLWALHVIITGIGARLDMVTTFTAVQFVVVALLAGINASFIEPLSLDAMVRAAPDLLYVGILSSALTFTLLAVALRATRAAEATVILSTESLFAAFGAFLFLGERLQFIGWLGAGTIFIATLVVQMPGRSAAAKE